MGNRVRQLRQERGLSVNALARLAGVGDYTVYRWEHGRADPTRAHARQLARALGIRPADIFTADEPGAAAMTTPSPSSSDLPSVASVYVVEAGRLLMTKRRFPESGGFEWAAISGQIEPGETPEQAAVREAREEVGLDIEVTGRLGERVHPATGRHLIYMSARVVGGAAAMVDHEENSHFDWADLATVRDRWATLRGGIFPPVLAYLAAAMPVAPTAE